MTARGGALVMFVLLAVSVGCVGRSGAGESVRETGEPVAIRLAVEVADDVAGPVYVLLNGEDGQVGWVTVLHEGRRVHLQERCEIEDCGARGVVCGAAVPVVRDISAAGGGRSIEFVWDGTVSVLDSVSGCETRREAPSGAYVARFCRSGEAEIDPDGDAARGVMGRLVRPTCEDRAFTLPAREVVLEVR